jgi:integrase
MGESIWRPALGMAGLPAKLRIHDLRHRAAALLISQGGHPEAIKRQLGHSSILVTMDIYGYLFPSDAEALADRMNELSLASQTDMSQTDRRRTSEPPAALRGAKTPHQDAA